MVQDFSHQRYQQEMNGWEVGSLLFCSIPNPKDPDHSVKALTWQDKWPRVVTFIRKPLCKPQCFLKLCRVPSWKRSHLPSQPALLKMMFCSFPEIGGICYVSSLEGYLRFTDFFCFACYLLVQGTLFEVGVFLSNEIFVLTNGFLDICLPPST